MLSLNIQKAQTADYQPNKSPLGGGGTAAAESSAILDAALPRIPCCKLIESLGRSGHVFRGLNPVFIEFTAALKAFSKRYLYRGRIGFINFDSDRKVNLKIYPNIIFSVPKEEEDLATKQLETLLERFTPKLSGPLLEVIKADPKLKEQMEEGKRIRISITILHKRNAQNAFDMHYDTTHYDRTDKAAAGPCQIVETSNTGMKRTKSLLPRPDDALFFCYPPIGSTENPHAEVLSTAMIESEEPSTDLLLNVERNYSKIVHRSGYSNSPEERTIEKVANTILTAMVDTHPQKLKPKIFLPTLSPSDGMMFRQITKEDGLVVDATLHNAPTPEIMEMARLTTNSTLKSEKYFTGPWISKLCDRDLNIYTAFLTEDYLLPHTINSGLLRFGISFLED